MAEYGHSIGNPISPWNSEKLEAWKLVNPKADAIRYKVNTNDIFAIISYEGK